MLNLSALIGSCCNKSRQIQAFLRKFAQLWWWLFCLQLMLLKPYTKGIKAILDAHSRQKPYVVCCAFGVPTWSFFFCCCGHSPCDSAESGFVSLYLMGSQCSKRAWQLELANLSSLSPLATVAMTLTEVMVSTIFLLSSYIGLEAMKLLRMMNISLVSKPA